MIRFWDTSALAKVYLSTELGHDHARRLAEEPRIPRVRHATSVSAVRGKARGADTAIAAQAILFAMAAAEPCEFVTADGQQAALIGASQLAGTASLSVVQLAP